MKITNKIKGLVNTYIDMAASESEQNTSFKLAFNLIVKNFQCDKFVAISVLDFFIYKSCYFDDRYLGDFQKTHTILKQMGVSFKVEKLHNGAMDIIQA